MNKDNAAFQRGMFSGDWSDFNRQRSEGRYAGMGGGRSSPRAISMMVFLCIGLFLGLKGGPWATLAGMLAGAVFGLLLAWAVGASFRLVGGLFRRDRRA